MANAVSGVNGVVMVGAVDANVSGWSIDFDVNAIDVTTTADAGWRHVIAGEKSIKGSFDFFYDYGNKPTGASLNIVAGVTIANLQLFVDKVNHVDDVFSGPALVTKLSIKTKTKDAVAGTCSFENAGVWTVPS